MWLRTFYNRPFPSGLKSLFQRDATCKSIDMKMFLFFYSFARKVLHLASFWKSDFGPSLIAQTLPYFNCLSLRKDFIIFPQRAQHKPATQMQRPPQDSKKHPGDHAHQRSSDLKRPTDGGGPGGKIPRMDRTYSGSSSHSGGRPSGSGDSYDPRRSSSFSHSDRTGTSSKERSRDGYVFILQARVVQTLDCAIHRINHSLAVKYWGNQVLSTFWTIGAR